MSKRNKILCALKRYELYHKEIFVSTSNEIILILSDSNIRPKTVYLIGENGESQICDSQIFLTFRDSMLKIDDFISNSKNKGYGRFLLEYVIQKAKETNIDEIVGELSPVDHSKFDWLIP